MSGGEEEEEAEEEAAAAAAAREEGEEEQRAKLKSLPSLSYFFYGFSPDPHSFVPGKKWF